METKIKEDNNLQIIESVEPLEETLKRSPFFVSMPEDEYETLIKALHEKGFC